MLDFDLQRQIDQLYREEMRQYAENARLVREINGKQAPYAPVLALMGKTLSVLGDKLQERYGELNKRTADDANYQLETV